MLKIPLKGFLNDRIQDKMIFIHTKTPSNAVKKLIQNTQGFILLPFHLCPFHHHCFDFLSHSDHACLISVHQKKKIKLKCN